MPQPSDPRVTVWARVNLPGFHRWPDAPKHRDYLAARHRHLFHITAAVHPTHDDRAVEFHDLADLVRDWWGPGHAECGPSSCETLARALAHHLTSEHKLTVASVEVSEDGEVGAAVHPEGP